MSGDELKKLWKCNDQIAALNIRRLQDMNLHSHLTPAILAYEGIQYRYMAPNCFEYGDFDYVEEHLRILSGFYGVLKPMDGVTPYRLEMQAKAHVGDFASLYEFWGDRLYREVVDESRIVINLASKEYSRAIELYLQPEDTFITCTFAEDARGKLVQKGVYCKMARGEMVRFMASNNVESPEQLKDFDSPDYRFCPERSSETEFVFLRVS